MKHLSNIVGFIKSLEEEISLLNPVEKLIVASEFIKVLNLKEYGKEETKERRKMD